MLDAPSVRIPVLLYQTVFLPLISFGCRDARQLEKLGMALPLHLCTSDPVVLQSYPLHLDDVTTFWTLHSLVYSVLFAVERKDMFGVGI